MTEKSHVLSVTDQETNSEALVLLRSLEGGKLAFGLSLADNGDIEVVLTRRDASEVLRLLGSILEGHEN